MSMNNMKDNGYAHTVTFSHRFLLFGSKLEFPWDCGTIQSHAKTLPCARSQCYTLDAQQLYNVETQKPGKGTLPTYSYSQLFRNLLKLN